MNAQYLGPMIPLAQGIPSSGLYFILVYALLGTFFLAPLLAIGFGIAGFFYQPRFKEPAAICAGIWVLSAIIVVPHLIKH
jgi:hypothetical protein